MNNNEKRKTPILDEHLDYYWGRKKEKWSPVSAHDSLSIEGLFEYDKFNFVRDSLKRNSRVVLRPFYKAYKSFGDHPFKTQPLAAEFCPYCGKEMTLSESYETKYEIGDEGLGNEESDELLASLEYCLNCRFWRWHYLTSFFYNRGGVYSIQYTSAMPKIDAFNPSLPLGCSTEIAQALRRDPKIYHSINTKTFEKFVADVFRANHANAEVIHVGQPHDGGKDVIFIDDGDNKWLISVKRRASPEKSEGVETIRSLIGVLFLNQATRGMVVSSANHFTYHAKKAANFANNEGLQIRLVDRGLLDRMLGSLLPHWPWENYLKEFSPAAWKLFSSKNSVDGEPLA